MRIYKKAYPLLLRIGIIIILIDLIAVNLPVQNLVILIIILTSIIIYLFIVGFFRVPDRICITDNNLVYAPADGTIVAVEEAYEDEFLKQDCKKVSIFMSVFNIHQNRIPVSGTVIYLKHHPGKYLVAWHPKSSSKNEHTSAVIETPVGARIKIVQIAGLVARRIICNLEEGKTVQQGDELGFILFGSRVDVFLPKQAKIMVTLGDNVKANKHVIADIGLS